SGDQIPPPSHVVPPARASTTAATPAAKAALEIIPPRQRPNDPAMISIARGNEVSTTKAHATSFNPDVSEVVPEPAIEYESAAHIPANRRSIPPTAVLEAVAAAPQPSCPASARVVLSAAANHSRLRTVMPQETAAIRMRTRSPV